MIPIALALLMSDTTPAKDTLSDLSKILSEVSKRSSIVVVQTYEKVSIATDPKIVDDLVDPLRKMGFASLVSDVPVIYQMGIPASHLGVLKGLLSAGAEAPKAGFKEVTIPQTAVKDNLITFETKAGEAIKVSTLMNLDLPKKIMVSPYYTFENGGDFPLAMSAKNMVPAEFVRALTRGLSGKLVIEEKSYTISFDATSFRSNMAKILTVAQKGVDEGRTPSGINVQYSGGSYSDYQEYQDAAQPAHSSSKASLTSALTLLGKSISTMNDKLLEQTFAYKGTSTRLSLATFTSLQEFAINYLKSASTPPSGQSGTSVQRQQPGRPSSNLAGLVNRVDPQNPGRLVITTDFRVSLELNIMQRGGQQGGRPQPAEAANTITVQVL